MDETCWQRWHSTATQLVLSLKSAVLCWPWRKEGVLKNLPATADFSATTVLSSNRLTRFSQQIYGEMSGLFFLCFHRSWCSCGALSCRSSKWPKWNNSSSRIYFCSSSYLVPPNFRHANLTGRLQNRSNVKELQTWMDTRTVLQSKLIRPSFSNVQ